MPRAVRTRKTAVQDKVFKALADGTRRRILVVLGGGERRVADIAARFDVSRPAISRHLAVLKRAGLVTMRRQGRDNLYAIAPAALREAAAYVQEIEAFWGEKMERLARTLAREPRAERRPGGRAQSP